MNTYKIISDYHSALMLNILIVILCVQIRTTLATSTSGVSKGEELASKSFPLMPEEPTCEQLRAMWIFSKRQSRAAELTNEIPTYRDPFAYNVWNPYYALNRQTGHTVLDGSRHATNAKSPVFGRIINQEPIIPTNLVSGHRSANYKGGIVNGTKRPITTSYRYVGGSASNPSGQLATTMANPNGLTVQGSFHKLKELIWTERAKELTQQRRLEEMAARAAVLKEIANGQNIESSYNKQGPSDSMLMDENRSPETDYIENGRTFKSQQQQPPLTKADRSTTINRSNIAINHHKFNRAGFGTGARFHQQRLIPAYLRQQQQQSFADFDDNLDKDVDPPAQTPRWRNSAGILQKYPRPRGSTHFRERQRTLIGKVPAENKFYQRIARTLESPKNKQLFLMHEILGILNSKNNNNYENAGDENENALDEDSLTIYNNFM